MFGIFHDPYNFLPTHTCNSLVFCFDTSDTINNLCVFPDFIFPYDKA